MWESGLGCGRGSIGRREYQGENENADILVKGGRDVAEAPEEDTGSNHQAFLWEKKSLTGEGKRVIFFFIWSVSYPFLPCPCNGYYHRSK